MNVKVLVGAFNQEKALVGAISVITNLHVGLRFKLYYPVCCVLTCNHQTTKSHTRTVSGDSLHSARFQQFARTGAQRWLEVISDWLQYSSDLHTVYYEVSTVQYSTV